MGDRGPLRRSASRNSCLQETSARSHPSARRLSTTAGFILQIRAQPLQCLLCRSGVRGHRPEVVFGMLVVILCPDQIAGPDFSLSQRQIPFVVSLRILRTFRLGAADIRCPLLWAGSKCRCRSSLASPHVYPWTILHPFFTPRSWQVKMLRAPHEGRTPELHTLIL